MGYTLYFFIEVLKLGFTYIKYSKNTTLYDGCHCCEESVRVLPRHTILTFPPRKLFLWLEYCRDSLSRMLTTVSISFHWVPGVPIICWEVGWGSSSCRAAKVNEFEDFSLINLVFGKFSPMILSFKHASLDRKSFSIFS